jgi:hypothetical protein
LHFFRGSNPGESLALDDAENPLQLLARASDLQLSPKDVRNTATWPLLATSQPATGVSVVVHDNVTAAKSFFVPVRASLDIGPDMDPIDIGLVTLLEAESLFALYVLPNTTGEPNMYLSFPAFMKTSRIPDGDSTL